MILKLVKAPACEPITLSDVEGQVRLQGQLSDEAATVELMISAVRERSEAVTRRALITQTWDYVFNRFPSDNDRAIIIPKPPLQSIESIKYIDLDGVEQTIDPSLYKVDTDSEPGRIVPAYGMYWPTPRSEINAVRVRFICGYGPISEEDTADNVPKAIKQWMLINVANLLENRETIGVAFMQSKFDLTETIADGLIDNLRISRL